MKILTFDIEDWFHLLDNDSTKTTVEWKRFESRIYINVDRILKCLDDSNSSATFFVLGWIGSKYPEVVKMINQQGHEIASHSNLHQLVYSLSPKEFKDDTYKSIQIIEGLIGKKVRYYRAPGFSITKSNLWSLEILSELGIEIDCSVFPARRAHGGIPEYGSPEPSIIKYNGIEIKEFPINFKSFYGQKIIFSGGGYFRLLPYSLIKHWTNKSKYIMSYFHPRDFDSQQPRIENLSAIRKFKSYVGLSTSEDKFKKWLSDYDFMDISTAVTQIKWENVPKVVF